MSDTETTATAPARPLSPAQRMAAAVASLAAGTAQAATREVTASPETPVTAAAGVESETATDPNTAQATQADETPGEGQTEEPSSFPAPDSVVFVAEDGTPVTADEARKGYLRQAEFTKKTQTLAEQVKVYSEREGVIAQARDVYVQRLQAVEQLLARQVPAEPDPALRFGTPDQQREYLLQMQDRNEALVRLAAAHEERNRLQQEQTAEQQRKQAEHQQAQQALILDIVPKWKDPNVAAREKAEVREFLTSMQFDDDQISRAIDGRADHRLLAMARWARIGKAVEEGSYKGGAARAQASAMPQPTRAEVQRTGPVSRDERDLRAARDQLGSGSRHDRFHAALQIQARNEEARRGAARPR